MADDPIPTDRRFVVEPLSPLTQPAQWFSNLEAFPGQIWYQPNLASKNKEVKVARREIVRQARQLERSNELIRGGLDRNSDMAVGAQIKVHPQPNWELLGITDPEVRKNLVNAFRREFNDWAYDSRLLCDGDGGHYDFGGMMWMAYRNLIGPDAECAITVHYDENRARDLGSRWATYITVIDPDRIATPSDLVDDKAVFEGRRFLHNRFVGMYVRTVDPETEAYTGDSGDYEYVPRETAWGRPMAIHFFIKTRGGQQRGLSNLSTVVAPSTRLDKFDEAYIRAAIVASELATYIQTKSSAAVVAERLAPAPGGGEVAAITDANWGFFSRKVDYYGKAKFRVGSAGRLAVLPPDDEVKMTAADRSIADPGPFRREYQRMLASSVGNGFEQFALNYSESNYSSARAQDLQTWRGTLRMRRLFAVPVMTPIFGAVIEEAIQRGRIQLPAGAPGFQEYRTAWTSCAWSGPSMPQIDPEKEEKANTFRLQNRTTSRTRIAAEQGDDIYELIDEMANEQEYAEARGVDLTPPNQVLGAQGGDQQSSGGGDQAPAGKKKSTKGGTPGRDGDGDGQVDEKASV